VVRNIQTRVADGKLDYAGMQLNPNAQFGHIQTLDENVLPYTKVLAVTGACLLLYKADFDAQGGFDERFINGCEDIGLCFKLRGTGKDIYVANTSHIRHHVSLSRDVNTLQNERNSRHLFSRWHKLIKQELAAEWAALLQAVPQAYAELLSGQLCPALHSRPRDSRGYVAARRNPLGERFVGVNKLEILSRNLGARPGENRMRVQMKCSSFFLCII
jgi:hypothetical protein